MFSVHEMQVRSWRPSGFQPRRPEFDSLDLRKVMLTHVRNDVKINIRLNADMGE